MTLDEMQQITINHWKATAPEKMRRWRPSTIARESLACAKLTRMEMDTIKIGTGLTEEEAWQESRHLFCLAPAPNLGR